VSSILRRFAAAAAAAAALPIVVIGVTQGVAGAAPGPGPGTTVPTYTTPPPPLVCERGVSVANRTVYEGTRTETNNIPYTYVTFTVSSSGCSAAGSVDYFTFPGSATAGVDYYSRSGTLRFESGDSGSRTVTVPVVKDPSPGDNEVFHLFLTDASSQVDIDDGFATATILNDDSVCVPPWDWTPPPPPYQGDYHCSE
jgi:hypothetical protein